MTILVSLTVALSLAILGFAAAQSMIQIARRFEQDYINRASKELAAIHATVDARVIWQASLFTALLAGLAGLMLTRGWLVAGVLGACGALFPLWFLRVLRQRRLTVFHDQLPDMISQVRTAVACGYTLPMALAMAQRQLPAPAGQELKVLSGQLRLGIPLSEAMARLQHRVPSEDLDLFVGAITMAERAGGQLGQILLNIEQTVRERLRLQKKLSTMTSQGRMEAWIISIGPFALGGAMYMMNPQLMMNFFTHPLGIPACVAGLIWMGIGYGVIRRILTPQF